MLNSFFNKTFSYPINSICLWLSVLISFHVFGSENSSNFDITYLNYCLDTRPHEYFEKAVNNLPEIEYTAYKILHVMYGYHYDENKAQYFKKGLHEIHGYYTDLQDCFNSGFGLFKFLFVAGLPLEKRGIADYPFHSAIHQQYKKFGRSALGLSIHLCTSLAHIEKINIAVKKCDYLYKPLPHANRIKTADKFRSQKNYFGRF